MKGMFFINFYWLMDASRLWDTFWDEYEKVSQETREVVAHYARWWAIEYFKVSGIIA